MNDHPRTVVTYHSSFSTAVFLLALTILALSGVCDGNVMAADPDGEQFFTETIEPILKKRCLGCHSHAGEIEGSLTLDSRNGWVEGGNRGPAIVPGKADASLLVKAIRRVDPQLQMPPDERLSATEIELLVQWITRGAPDPRKSSGLNKDVVDPLDWWSLRPLRRPPVPQVAHHEGAIHGPIDAFIQQRLEAEGLTPAGPATRRTVIQRLYFDLHGLPPTPAAVEAFVNNPDPLAYEQLVDRLLDSPRYGERWARHWLDTIHFADSHGCEHDVYRPNAWRYRDYVIDRLNADIPWARFIREQLAADTFFPEQPELTTALGFIAAGPLELSRASTAPVTFDYLDRDDILTQTMASFASATANCARCHNHKFDPITQEDYYSLQAVFSGAGKGDVEFDADAGVARQRRRWTELLAIASGEDQARLLAPEFAEMVTQWEEAFANQATTWVPLSPSTLKSSDGTTLQRLEDDSVLASGTRPDKDTYTLTMSPGLSQISALRLDVLADDRLPMKGPGRQDNGNLHLNEFEVFVLRAGASEPTRLPIRTANADWDQAGWTIKHAIDDKVETAWGIFPKVGQSHHAVFELAETCELETSCQIVVVLKQLHGRGHVIGRLKLYATAGDGAKAQVLPEAVRLATKIQRDQRTTQQQAAIAAYALRIEAEKQLAALPAPTVVYAVSDEYSHGKKLPEPATPKVVHVLRRGDIHQPDVVAQPGALSAIAALPSRFELDDPNDEGSRRAALADWLAAPDNPLTWRSVVNRVWSHHFGRGLCDTPNDFGRMGGVPSHPELLDWLAVWFRDDAHGSLKQLHRLILCSATYQRRSDTEQSSLRPGSGDPRQVNRRDPRSRDAGNRLLWRMNRRRLDAESYRDAILQHSDRIDLTMGGPGIQQFTQSTGSQLTPKLHYDAFDWTHPSASRRSIYRVVWRGIADPFMESLDFPDLGLLAPKRGFSVSALQALTLYNNDFVLHHSQLLATRLEADCDTIDDQLNQAYQLIFFRAPSETETTALREYTSRYGLAATCRILFNSNEFLFID